MAEGAAPEVADLNTVAAVDMDVKKVEADDNCAESNQKRAREDEEPCLTTSRRKRRRKCFREVGTRVLVLNVNKYEHAMLLELLKNGHAEPDKKIGGGVCAFQLQKHPTYKSRCFFLIREDDSADDFSFRECVGHILPLPEEMHLKSDANKALGSDGGGGGKHRGHGGKGGRGWGGRGGGRGGHGRGGKWRH
ncbi:hypothetical protein VNO80_19621 [Phaseolus coccineus]|uniref:Uncharacterized protein n=1 Tax=Phaseolus coccineus TaxID=3886 RepID=A0AAN9MLA1_PHACN